MSDGLFFTDPDDLDVSNEATAKVRYSEDIHSTYLDFPRPTKPQAVSIASQQIHGKRLFFPDSDDESIPIFEVPRNSILPMTPLASNVINDSGSDLELPSIALRVSSMSPMASRDSPPPRVTIRSSPPPTKKWRLSLPTQPKGAVRSDETYVGSFLVPNAWSTVKGKGYIKPEEEVRIERDSPEGAGAAASGKGKKKQLTLKAMLKPQPVKNVKRKTDTIVRLTNKGGFGAYFVVKWQQAV